MLWMDLTPSDFLKAREEAQGLCVLPVASIERHGSHCPLGVDSFVGEEVARRAAEREPAVVLPVLPYAVNGEAAANPGAVALSSNTLFALLEELCNEIGRNGFTKIMLFSSHGGNIRGLPFFVQQSMLKERSYVMYYFMVGYGDAAEPKAPQPEVYRSAGHGGQYETSAVMAARPGTVKMKQLLPPEQAHSHKRLQALHKLGVYGPMHFYADFPNHYAGDATGASVELGKEMLEDRTAKLVEALRAVKADAETPALMREFRTRMGAGGTMSAGE